MPGLDLLAANLLQPIVLAFVLGAIGGFVKSELELPEAVIKLLSIYLLFSLGLTGGRELAKAEMGTVLTLMGMTLLMTFAIPSVVYLVTRRLGRDGHTSAGLPGSDGGADGVRGDLFAGHRPCRHGPSAKSASSWSASAC